MATSAVASKPKVGGANRDSTRAKATANKTNDAMTLSELYPVHSSWELTLAPTGIVRGRVYTTDQTSGSIVLLAEPNPHHANHKQQNNHSNHQQQSTIHIIQAKHIVQAKPRGPSNAPQTAIPQIPTKISRKALEEREKKAIRLAEESLRHINEKASPAGQACFDRLLKACNIVEWGEHCSILVLKEIQVDQPYTPASCKIINATSGQANASLERVRKIVAATNAVSGSSNKK